MPESVTDRPTKAHEYIFLLTKSARYFWDQEAVREQTEAPGSVHVHKDNQKYPSNIQSAPSHNIISGAFRNIRSVWTIPTYPYSEAHFATFPPALVTPMIKAGTSERGCCPACGASWVRVVERGKLVPDAPGYKPRGRPRPHPLVNRMEQKGGIPAPNHHYEHTTIGWRPDCPHYPGADEWVEYERNPEADPEIDKRNAWARGIRLALLDRFQHYETVPCRTLDPFGGAGTVGLVADRLGRDATLIELSSDYCAMARDRIKGDAPMLVDVRME
jgi:hypothetical protein